LFEDKRIYRKAVLNHKALASPKLSQQE